MGLYLIGVSIKKNLYLSFVTKVIDSHNMWKSLKVTKVIVLRLYRDNCDCTAGSELIFFISRTKIQSMFNQSTHIIKQCLSPIASSTLRNGKKMLLSNKNVYRFYLKKNLPSTISFFTFRDFHRCECCSKEVRWPNKYKFLQYIHPSIKILLYSYTSGIDSRINV